MHQFQEFTRHEMFDQIGGANVFPEIDLKKGFHQRRMKAGNVENTVFNTIVGLF